MSRHAWLIVSFPYFSPILKLNATLAATAVMTIYRRWVLSNPQGAFEAKNRLSELLEKARHGQRIQITKRGRPVAVLGPVEDEAKTKHGRVNVLVRARKLREQQKAGSESLKALIEEGRRI